MSQFEIARGYDRLAPFYDRLASLVYGSALRKAQTCMLAQLPQQAAILVLGGGSGWFLEQLLRIAKPCRVVYVELSAEMFRLSQERIWQNLPTAFENVEFVLGRAEDADRLGHFDVVVTHCLLDMYPQAELQALMARLSPCMQAGGYWYFSDFAHVASWPMRWISGGLIWLMYRFFRWSCAIPARELPDFGVAFAKAGLLPIAESKFFGQMIQAKLFRRGGLQVVSAVE